MEVPAILILKQNLAGEPPKVVYVAEIQYESEKSFANNSFTSHY